MPGSLKYFIKIYSEWRRRRQLSKAIKKLEKVNEMLKEFDKRMTNERIEREENEKIIEEYLGSGGYQPDEPTSEGKPPIEE